MQQTITVTTSSKKYSADDIKGFKHDIKEACKTLTPDIISDYFDNFTSCDDNRIIMFGELLQAGVTMTQIRITKNKAFKLDDECATTLKNTKYFEPVHNRHDEPIQYIYKTIKDDGSDNIFMNMERTKDSTDIVIETLKANSKIKLQDIGEVINYITALCKQQDMQKISPFSVYLACAICGNEVLYEEYKNSATGVIQEVIIGNIMPKILKHENITNDCVIEALKNEVSRNPLLKNLGIKFDDDIRATPSSVNEAVAATVFEAIPPYKHS